eukprot:6200634-Alexandrium_andersonii.AAC.1
MRNSQAWPFREWSARGLVSSPQSARAREPGTCKVASGLRSLNEPSLAARLAGESASTNPLFVE